MNLPDEELQNRIERGNFSDDTLDQKAYQQVFASLKKEPYVLPSSFADQVINRIENKSTLSKDYLWFGLGLLLLVGGAIFAAVQSDFKLNFGVLRLPSGYTGLIVFGLAFILLLHYLDKQLIQRRARA